MTSARPQSPVGDGARPALTARRCGVSRAQSRTRRTAALRARLTRVQETALDKLGDLRATRAWVDFTMLLYERDKESDGSVIAAAVALRVFLFFVPLVLFLVGALGFA